MGKFTAVSSEAFTSLQFETGMLLKNFDVEHPDAPADADIICATTGGISITCVPRYKDHGADIDNVQENTMELMQHLGTDCKIGTTAVNITEDILRMAIGTADSKDGHVSPRIGLKSADFQSIWWVGDLSNGGFAAVKLSNALSTSGLTLKTKKNGLGNLDVEFSGFYTVTDQKKVPMDFYVAGPETAPAAQQEDQEEST